MANENNAPLSRNWPSGTGNMGNQTNWNGEPRYPANNGSGNYNGVVSMEPMQQDWSGEIRYPDMSMQQSGNMSNAPWYHISYEDLRGADFPNGSRESLDLQNPQTQQEKENPMSNTDVYHGSMKNLLSRNLGYYVVATFQMGNQGTVSVPGILYTVGNDYIVLYQPEQGRYVTGDLFALKFVEFHDTKSVPRQSYVQPMQ